MKYFKLSLTIIFIILICAWFIFYFCSFFLTHDFFSSFTLNLLLINGVALLLLIGFFGVGSFLASRFFQYQNPSLEKIVVSFAIGAGFFSLFILIVGLCGFLTSLFLWICFIFLLLIGVREWKPWFEYVYFHRGIRIPLWVYISFILVLVFWARLGVYGYLPPYHFDVVQCHLAIPLEYFNMGAIRHLPHDIFSTVCMNAHMIFLWGLGLLPMELRGAISVQLVNYVFTILTAVAIFLLAKLCFNDTVLALITFLTTLVSPLLLRYSYIAYIEPQVTFYITLTIFLAIKNFSISQRDNKDANWFLVGLVMGLAIGTKLNALFVTFPLLVLVFLFSNFKSAWAFLKGVFLTAIPWLLRNLILTGDPIYPHLFTPKELRSELFYYVHSPKGFNFLGKLWDFFDFSIGDLRILIVILLVISLVDAIQKRHKVILRLWFLFMGFFIMWFFFTVQTLRYLCPIAGIFCLLVINGVYSIAKKLAFYLVSKTFFLIWIFIIFLGFIGFYSIPGLFDISIYCLDPAYPRREVAKIFEGSNTYTEAYEWMRRLPSGCRTLMLGETCSFYAPPGTYYHSLYNENPVRQMYRAHLEGRLEEWFQSRGITHIYVNLAEWKRRDETFVLPAHYAESASVYVGDKKASDWFFDYFLPTYAEVIHKASYNPEEAPLFSFYKLKFFYRVKFI